MPYLKEREIKLLGILKKYNSVKDAYQDIARELNMSPRAVYNVLYRLRLKQVEARYFINSLLTYRRTNLFLAKLLTPKIPLEEEKEISREDIVGMDET